MEKYDVIIIGAGPSGLCTGALLAKGGKKILILEKHPWTGGKRHCGMINGVLLEDGAFGPSRQGYLEDIFSNIGKPYPSGRNMEKTEINRNGGWRPLLEGADRKKLRAMLTEIGNYSYDEITKYDNVSLKNWISKRTNNQAIHNFFFLISTGVLVANCHEYIAAGEALMHFKQHLDRWGNISNTVQLIYGGSPKIIEPLVEAIKEERGEIRTGTSVTDIIVENGKVCGVEIEVGEKLITGQVLDVEVIDTPIVVCTVPPWELFKTVSEDKFPYWYVELVKRIRYKFSHVAGFTIGLKNPVWDYEVMRWYLPELPRTKVALAAYYETKTVLQTYVQLHWHEMPFLYDQDKAISKRKSREFLKLLEEDLYEVFPDLKQSIEWKVPSKAVFSIAQAPGLVGSNRPGLHTPIENLYLVGNNYHYREARAMGYQTLAKSATLCADEILGKNR
jgi:phytoene dehydrogenase-like protein